MATGPLNSTVVVDDTNPALVYSGVWVRFVSVAPASPAAKNVFIINVLEEGLQVSSMVRLTVAHRRDLLYALPSMVCLQRCLTLLVLSRLPIGTSVAVYGTIQTDTPISAYTLDGSTPSVFAASKFKTTVYRQLFFHSPTLTDVEHTLLITNMGSGQLWIDYILYTQSSPSQPASSSASSSLPPSTTPSLQPTFTTSQTPNIDTPTPSPPTSNGINSSTGLPDQVNSNSKSSIPAPAVAGGAIGALVLIIVLIFGLLYYRRRAKRLAGEKLLEKNNIFGGKIKIHFPPHLKLRLRVPRRSPRTGIRQR